MFFSVNFANNLQKSFKFSNLVHNRQNAMNALCSRSCVNTSKCLPFSSIYQTSGSSPTTKNLFRCFWTRSVTLQDTNRQGQDITAPYINLISETGEKLGIFSTRKVLSQLLTDQILVEVGADANPPFCRIFSKKAMFEKKKELKKKEKKGAAKEIKVKVTISPHDLQTKVNHSKKVLSKGDSVRFNIMPASTSKSSVKAALALMSPIYDSVSKELIAFGTLSEPLSVVEGVGYFSFKGKAQKPEKPELQTV